MSDAYDFTVDWFTGTARPVFEELLSPLAGRPGLRLVEVGSFEGRSACWLVETLLGDPSASLTCVDLWWNSPETERRFDMNILATGRSNQVRKIKGPSCFVLPTLERGACDVVYVDGNHEGRNVCEDGFLGWRLLKVGGLLIFDDYGYSAPNHARLPKVAIDAFLDLHDGVAEVLHHGYVVGVRKVA